MTKIGLLVVVIALYIDVEEPYYIITYYIQLFTEVVVNVHHFHQHLGW